MRAALTLLLVFFCLIPTQPRAENPDAFIGRMDALISEHELDAAQSQADALLAASRDGEEDAMHAMAALHVLGTIDLAREDYLAAINRFSACREYPRSDLHDDCTNRLAEAYWRLGALSEAARHLIELGEHHSETGDLEQLLRVWNNLAIIHAEMQELDRAEEYFSRGLETVQKIDDPELEASAWNNLAKLAHIRGELDQAQAHMERAMLLGRAHAGPGTLSSIHHVNGSILATVGDLEEALEEFDKAVAHAEAVGMTSQVADAKTEMGQVLLAMERPDDALAILGEAMSIIEMNGLDRQRARIHELMRDAHENLGEYRQALHHARQLESTRQEIMAQEQRRDVRRMDTLFRVSQAERRAEMAAAEAELSRVRLGRQRAWMFVAGLATLLLLVVMAAWLTRVRQRHRLEHDVYLKELRYKQDFSAMLVHDLHAPVRVITRKAKGIRELSDDPRMQVISEEIQANCDGMTDLVRNLLELSSNESSELSLERRQARIRQVVERAAQEVTPTAEQKGVTLTITGEELPAVNVDDMRMAHVLDNLLGNAIRRTADQGEVLIELAQDRDRFGRGTSQLVRVIDEGGRVSPEALEQIFRASGSSRHPGHHTEGSELGLAVARMIVRAHGGELKARNRPDGHGLIMEIRLPEST